MRGFLHGDSCSIHDRPELVGKAVAAMAMEQFIALYEKARGQSLRKKQA